MTEVTTLKLLLIDDDDVDRRAVVRALKAAALDAELVEVTEASVVLDVLQESDFDCMLLDYRLPQMDGLDVLLRTRAAGFDLPVIILTGQGDEQLAVDLMKAGASDYLSKATLSENRLRRSVLQAIELHRARVAAKRAERSLELLARAGEALANDLDLTKTLTATANLLVPEWGDYCSVQVVQDDGRLGLGACASRVEDKARLVRQIMERINARMRSRQGSPEVVRTGHSQLLNDFSEAKLREMSGGDEELYDLIRQLGTRSGLVVPLHAHGTTIGTLTLGSCDARRRYTSSDVKVVEEVGRRATVAIDSSRLFELSQRERRHAEEANRSKDEFLAVVSHEIRTPLNAILGWSRMLLTGSLVPEQRERALSTIERNARAQAQLIDDLLDVSRIITGKLRIEVAPVELVRVIEAAIDVVRPAADAKEVRIQSILDGIAGPLMGDADRLQQVVWNLLSNAVKFTPRGGRVVVRLERLDSSLVITVEDTGSGIEPDFLPFVFDRFRQAEMRSTRSRGGLGLGLSIVRHIAELHGGKVTAYSDGSGSGATFTVTLPVSPLRSVAPISARSSDPAQFESDAPELQCPPEIHGLSVLVVEDEPDARELLKSVLEYCQARVAVAGTVAEALVVMAAFKPDVIVSDIGLPGEDGYSLIDRVRRLPDEEGGKVPAVALTAYTRTEDRTRALLAGFNMYLPKPVEPRELLVVVASVSGRRSRPPSTPRPGGR